MFLELCRKNGDTVIHTCAKYNSLDSIITLVSYGAIVNGANRHNERPIDIATKNKRNECCNLLNKLLKFTMYKNSLYERDYLAKIDKAKFKIKNQSENHRTKKPPPTLFDEISSPTTKKIKNLPLNSMRENSKKKKAAKKEKNLTKLQFDVETEEVKKEELIISDKEAQAKLNKYSKKNKKLERELDKIEGKLEKEEKEKKTKQKNRGFTVGFDNFIDNKIIEVMKIRRNQAITRHIEQNKNENIEKIQKQILKNRTLKFTKYKNNIPSNNNNQIHKAKTNLDIQSPSHTNPFQPDEQPNLSHTNTKQTHPDLYKISIKPGVSDIVSASLFQKAIRTSPTTASSSSVRSFIKKVNLQF